MFYLFPMFLNHSVMSLVSFHCLTLIKFSKLIFILSNMDLRILPSLFLAGFSKWTSGLNKKFGFWSFKVIKQLLVPFTNIQLTTSLFLVIFFSSEIILLGIILDVDASYCYSYDVFF